MAPSINRPVASDVLRNHRVSIAVFRTCQVAARRKTVYFSVATLFYYFIRPVCVFMGGNFRWRSNLQFPLPPTKTPSGRLFFFFKRQKRRPFCDAQQLDGYGERQLKLHGYENSPHREMIFLKYRYQINIKPSISPCVMKKDTQNILYWSKCRDMY